MKHIWKSLLVALIVLISAQTAVQSQTYSLPGDGKDFWVGFVQPSYNRVAHSATVAFYGAYALISSYTDNHVTVSYFDKISGVEVPGTRYFVPERTGIQVPLNQFQMTPNDTGDVAEFCSCHITADRPINVEFFSSGACAGGSYLPITTAGLGKKYVIASYQNNPGELGIQCYYYQPSSIEVSEGFFEIIAPSDGTIVTITPNSTTMGGHTGYSSGKGANNQAHPYTVNLRRGQTYFVKSASDDNTDDISNSIIESNKAIAVIAGHENGAIGGVTNRLLEGRDYEVEAMYPYDMWDTTGFVMIPLKDSQPADASAYDGVGDMYRVFTSEKPGAQINFFDACISQPIQMSAGKFQSPPTERPSVTCPVDIEATNGVKFMAMLYDQRNFANSPPFPAPSMITVIPMSRWRTSFLWYVPANKFESLQGYYVNIIAPTGDFIGLNGIRASFNGGKIQPIKQVLSLEQQWKNIPNHPELTGVRFKLYPGSYYATGPNPFMVYNFGFRGLDPNNDLGDFDCDDYFFSYGLPVGVKLGSGTPHIRVTVDTFCSYWNVCAHDSTFGLTNQGIKSVTLLDDPHQDLVKANPPKVYYNTHLDDSLDPGNTREIIFSGDDSDVCFKVLVDRPIDSAYAPLFIADDQGNAIIVDLHYTPPSVRLTPDSGRYLLSTLNADTCNRFVFYNIGKTIKTKDTSYVIDPNPPHDTLKRNIKDTILHTGKSFTFTSDKLKLSNPNYTVTSTVPPLPTTLNAGDSLVIIACFNAKDTMVQRDTIELVNDCFTQPIDLIGSGATPLIIADDHDFGAVIVDSTKCAPVGVKNVGNAPLVLTVQWLMDNYGVNFTFPNAAALLPMTLKPGQKVTLTFCFTPHAIGVDSTVQHWGTTQVNPYLHSIKDTSKLIGIGVKSGFVWDRVTQKQTVICDNSDTVKVWLYNNTTDLVNGPSVHVDQVYITGPNASEFSILRDKNNQVPLANFDLNRGDSIWVDILFTPNLAQPANVKYLDRHMQLVAHGDTAKEKDQIIEFTGVVKHAIPFVTPISLDFGNVPLGVPIYRNFLLKNFGDAPLIVESIVGVTPPVIAVDSIFPGKNLDPNDSTGVVVQVTMVITNYTDTTVTIGVVSKTSCTDTMWITCHIAATYVNPSNTGHPFKPTFLDCRTLQDSILVQNLGTTPLTLERMDIINQNPPGVPQFAFDNGTQSMVVGTVFDPKLNKRTQFYHVTYSPTFATYPGIVTDSVLCTWDSLDVNTGKLVKKLYSGNMLTGVGLRERDTLTPVITTPTQQPYRTTGSNIDVQVNFSGFSRDSLFAGNILSAPEPIPVNIQANGMTFSVTYRRDLLNYNISSVSFDPSLTLVGAANPVPVADANGNETVTYNLKSKVGPITQKMAAANLQFEVMVSTDYSSPIAISNAYYWGADPSDSLCYVISEVGTTSFVPNPTCGDSSLRIALNGKTVTRIIGITPNPSIEGTTPVVTYLVNENKVPLTIELYNALGERIRIVEKDVPHTVGEFNLPLGVSTLPSGLYVLRITSPTSVESGQFVIQK
jgi:hypothetical protein